MKKIIIFILILTLFVSFVFAKDIWVNPYRRKDGTPVRGHWRSAPNETKADNFGPSRSLLDSLFPRSRDYDGDGIPNYRDCDDDGDGYWDDDDASQYNSGIW